MAKYSKLTDHELNLLLVQYNLGEVLQISPIEGGQANSSLKISTVAGDFILSICDEKNEEEIQNLTAILENLEEQKFPTTRLVKTKDDKRFILHNNKPVYIKKFLQGNTINELTPDMIQQVGRSMAYLHSLEPLASINSSFSYGIEAFEGLLNESINHQYLDWLAEKKSYLEQAIDPYMPKGFIHGDIFWDNLIFEDDSLVAILDFEEACHFYKLFDIGMSCVGCCSSNGSFNLPLIKELLVSYAVISPFISSEKSQLNIFVEYAAVAASFWRFRQYNIKNPNQDKADSYKELSSLADQIHTLGATSLLDWGKFPA